MLKYLESDPIVTGVKACEDYLKHSGSATFTADCTATQKTINHYAILYKYDRKTDNVFWMKDSRGTTWGDKGYIKFSMAKTDGVEGILGVQKGPWYSASFTRGTSKNLERMAATTSQCPGDITLPAWPQQESVDMDQDSTYFVLGAKTAKVVMEGNKDGGSKCYESQTMEKYDLWGARLPDTKLDKFISKKTSRTNPELNILKCPHNECSSMANIQYTIGFAVYWLSN
jgi:hypothetical protein